MLKYYKFDEIRKTMKDDLVIMQLFNPQNRRIVVLESKVEKFSSTTDGWGSFDEAAQFVQENYGYDENQIAILYDSFMADFDQ